MSSTTTAATTAIIAAAMQLEGLHGPKPTPALMINKNSSKIFKKHSIFKSPVNVVYLKSPEVVHVSPHEFMTTVQRLTGKPFSSSSHQDR
ncbi:hypothetical protein R6Q59_011569 [Mikania micrantha]